MAETVTEQHFCRCKLDNTLRLPAPGLAEPIHANPAQGRDHAEAAAHVVRDARQNQAPRIFTILVLQERDKKSKQIFNIKEKMKRLQTLKCRVAP